jgi:chromosome segregation ATPase
MEKLTIKAAAEYYGKSDSWIRKRILEGKLEAEKESFTYGERWVTTEKALDDLAERLNQTAKTENEVVEVRQVDRPVNKEKLINEIVEATESKNKALVDEAVNNITDKIEAQNEQLKQQNESLNQQQELIKKLSDQVNQLQQENNKSLVDKIKNLFK